MAKEVYEKATQLDITDIAPLIMVGVIFTENVVKEIVLYKSLFLRFLHVKDAKNGARPNERAQKQLLGGIEKLIEANKAKLINKVQNILYVAYENGLISEEVVIEWSKKVSREVCDPSKMPFEVTDLLFYHTCFRCQSYLYSGKLYVTYYYPSL